MSKAHVICCNDAVQYVILDDENKAREVLEGLKLAHYQKMVQEGFTYSYTEYSNQLFWHTHMVSYE